MDIHNELKYHTSLTNAFRILGGVDGSVHPGVERLGETLTPILNVWDLPEHAVLRNEQLGAAKAFQAAVAAEFSIIAWVNPATSKQLVVVEAISVGSSALLTTQLEVGAFTALAGTLTAPAQMVAARDRRFKPASQVGSFSLAIGSDLSNTFGVPLEQVTAANTAASTHTPFIVGLPVIVKPGDFVAVIGQTVNLSLAAQVRWRERPALPGELG